jgi:hypothetical protein
MESALQFKKMRRQRDEKKSFVFVSLRDFKIFQRFFQVLRTSNFGKRPKFLLCLLHKTEVDRAIKEKFFIQLQ